MINNTAFFIVAKHKPGGAERRFFYLCQHFHQTDRNPYLITNQELVDNLAAETSLHANVFKMKLSGARFLTPFFFIFNAIRYIRTNNIKHVHFCVGPSFYSLFMVRVLSSIGCTTSVSLVSSWIRRRSDLSLVQRFVWRRTIRSVDSIDILSPSILSNIYKVFGKTVFSGKQLSISKCSFSKRVDQIRDADNKFRHAETKVYDFIFASRLVETKGLDVFLEAMELCDKDGHNFTIAICGNGPLKSKVERVRFSNIKLIYLGYIEDMKNILLKSKVALSLQKYENYPSQFLLEALATNCDIISTDVGDTRLLLNENISTLIANDALSLKNAMINIDFDRSLYREVEVKKVLEQHSVKTFAKYIEALVTEARR